MDKCNICGINSDNIIRTGIITGNLCKQCFDKNYLTENGKRTYLRRDHAKLLKFIDSETSRIEGVDKKFLGYVLDRARKRYNMVFIGYKIEDHLIRLAYESNYNSKKVLKRINIKYCFKDNRIEVNKQYLDVETCMVKQEEIEVYEYNNGKVKIIRKV